MWSFWVNLFLLRAAILVVEKYTHPPVLEKSAAVIALAFGYFFVFNVIVLVWQVRGVIKAGDHYLSNFGAPVISLASHIGVAFCLLFTGFAAHNAYQSLFVKDLADSENRRFWPQSLLGDYSLQVIKEQKLIVLKGDFRVGITDAVTRLLDENPGVTGIVLQSVGGRVMEGRGLARLVRDRKLDTIVFSECKSACTTTFIGGHRRLLGPDGKLGFHQFSLDAIYYNPHVNPGAEQQIDLDFYAEQGVSKAFLDDVFQATHREMWFPDPARLVSDGVVHRILGPEEVPEVVINSLATDITGD